MFNEIPLLYEIFGAREVCLELPHTVRSQRSIVMRLQYFLLQVRVCGANDCANDITNALLWKRKRDKSDLRFLTTGCFLTKFLK